MHAVALHAHDDIRRPGESSPSCLQGIIHQSDSEEDSNRSNVADILVRREDGNAAGQPIAQAAALRDVALKYRHGLPAMASGEAGEHGGGLPTPAARVALKARPRPRKKLNSSPLKKASWQRSGHVAAFGSLAQHTQCATRQTAPDAGRCPSAF